MQLHSSCKLRDDIIIIIILYSVCFKFVYKIELRIYNVNNCRSQWARGLRHRSLAAHLLRLWVRIPPGALMFVCCECLCC